MGNFQKETWGECRGRILAKAATKKKHTLVFVYTRYPEPFCALGPKRVGCSPRQATLRRQLYVLLRDWVLTPATWMAWPPRVKGSVLRDHAHLGSPRQARLSPVLLTRLAADRRCPPPPPWVGSIGWSGSQDAQNVTYLITELL